MITIRHRVFWISVLKSSNSDKQRLVIYDPCLQARAFNDEFIILFELDEMQPAEFHKETVRGLIGNPPSMLTPSFRQPSTAISKPTA
jgi:hypothetical protein